MKKNVFIFGLTSGIIISTLMVFAAAQCCANPEMEKNDVLGYAGMIAAFSFIFVGIKNYRDKYNGGLITFGKALKTGLLITCVASTMYVVVWLVDYYFFVPEFIDKYTHHVLHEAKKDGASAIELQEKAAQMADFKEMYQNPLFIIIQTFMEVFPVGLIISLLSALLLKKKQVDKSEVAVN